MLMNGLALSYLAEPVKPRKRFGDSAFGAAAPRLWNELPLNICASGTLPMFRKYLKTYLFIISIIYYFN